MSEIYWWKIDRLNGKYLSLLLRRIRFIIIVLRAWRKSTLRRNDTIVEKNRPLKNRPLMTWITTTYLFWWFQCYVTRIRRPATRWDAAVVNKIFKGRRGFIIARYIHHICNLEICNNNNNKVNSKLFFHFSRKLTLSTR